MAKKAKKPTTGQRMADEMLVVQDMTKNRKLTEAAWWPGFVVAPGLHIFCSACIGWSREEVEREIAGLRKRFAARLDKELDAAYLMGRRDKAITPKRRKSK